MSQLTEISNRFKELQEKYSQHLPKIDPALINDLLLRQIENPSVTPLFMVEIFLKSGINMEYVRAAIRDRDERYYVRQWYALCNNSEAYNGKTKRNI